MPNSEEIFEILIRDQTALNDIHDFMNRPGPWNGGDVCEYVAEVLARTGREIPDPTIENDDDDDCCEHRPDDLPEPGDRCKDCGIAITWVGPSPYEWEPAR